MNRLRQINHFLEQFLYWTTALSSALFFLIVVVSVIVRYLEIPIMGSVEMSRLFFVWSCFLAAILCYRRKAHIAISFLFDNLSTKLQRAIAVLNHILILTFFSIVSLKSSCLVIDLWNTGLPMTGISQSWLYIPVPLVSGIALFFCVEEIIDLFSNNSKILKKL